MLLYFSKRILRLEATFIARLNGMKTLPPYCRHSCPPHTYSCSQSPQVRHMMGRLSTSDNKMAGKSASAGDLVGKVLQGTCGWSDSSIVKCGRFYPGSVKTTEDRLLHYSRVFPCVECDTSNYAIPSPIVVEKWLKCVPAGFKFHFKAFGFFTRKVRLNQQQLIWNKM